MIKISLDKKYRTAAGNSEVRLYAFDGGDKVHGAIKYGIIWVPQQWFRATGIACDDSGGYENLVSCEKGAGL